MCAILLGYLAGGALAWAATPGAWRLSFPETMAASVNAIRYGHPVEHYAQGIIVMMLVAAQLGALLCGSLAGLFGRLTRRSAANTA
jgi:hypothetical protein